MWIHESIKRSKKMKDHFNLNGVSVVIKDRLPDVVDPEFVLNYISSRVPFYLTQNVIHWEICFWNSIFACFE